MNWITKQLPYPQSIDEPCNDYYLVKPKNYPPVLAMYLENREGEVGWYTSYVSKIIVDLDGYLYIE